LKTHIIRLDDHDDVVSVRDKMAGGRAPRLLLVYPKRGRILDRTLDLRLLQRYAVSQGAQLALVARAASVRRAAAPLGIPVFRSTPDAQQYLWPEQVRDQRLRRVGPRPDFRLWRGEFHAGEPAWLSNQFVRLGLFALAVLAVLAVMLACVPSAEIRLDLRTRAQALTLPVRANPGIGAVNPAGVVPAYTLSGVVGGSRTASIETLRDVPDQPATGAVVFTNLTDSVIGIPAGTVIVAVGETSQRFVTLSDSVVAGEAGAEIDVPVQALSGGAAGNLPAGALVAIEGGLGAGLAVTNPAPLSGGSDRLAPVASEEDRAALRAALLEELRQQALEQFEASLEPGDLVFPASFAVVDVTAERYVPAEGQPGSRLTLTMQVEFRAAYAAWTDLSALAVFSLDASLPAGYVAEPGSLSLAVVGDPVTSADGSTQWRMRAQRQLHERADQAEVARLVQGQTRRAAAERLAQAFSLRSPPVFRLRPSWWPFLPSLPFRIVVDD